MEGQTKIFHPVRIPGHLFQKSFLKAGMGKKKKRFLKRKNLSSRQAEVEDLPVGDNGRIPDELEPCLVQLPLEGDRVVFIPEDGGAVAETQGELPVPERLGGEAGDLGGCVRTKDENLPGSPVLHEVELCQKGGIKTGRDGIEVFKGGQDDLPIPPEKKMGKKTVGCLPPEASRPRKDRRNPGRRCFRRGPVGVAGPFFPLVHGCRKPAISKGREYVTT
jgi:hypothetical protein